MKRFIPILLTLSLCLALCGCGGAAAEPEKTSDQLQIVATVFPAYDFSRQIAGERAAVTLLIPPGAEVHSFEPTAKDMVRIQNADLLVCNGGESEEWLEQLKAGCTNIGRNLNDTRGLFHSFLDCRQQMIRLFADLPEVMGERCLTWEIAFELRLKQSRYVRIYADVLVITENKVFSLEIKMKNAVDPAEVLQAAKYCPYLEILFGPDYEVIPVLVLTSATEEFEFVQIGKTDAVLPVCSGDMLFNVFDEYLSFLG